MRTEHVVMEVNNRRVTIHPDGRKTWEPASVKPAGLGDMIAAATTAVGIKPCSACKRRQAWLNRLGHAMRAVVVIALEPVRAWRDRVRLAWSRRVSRP